MLLIKSFVDGFARRVGKPLGRLFVIYQGAGIYISFFNFLLLILTLRGTYNLDFPVWLVLPLALFVVWLIGKFHYMYVMKHLIAMANEKNNILSEVRDLRRVVESLKR